MPTSVCRWNHRNPFPNLVDESGVEISFLVEQMFIWLIDRSDGLAISSQEDFLFYFFCIDRSVIDFNQFYSRHPYQKSTRSPSYLWSLWKNKKTDHVESQLGLMGTRISIPRVSIRFVGSEAMPG